MADSVRANVGKIFNFSALDDTDDIHFATDYPELKASGLINSRNELVIRKIGYVGNANDRLKVRHGAIDGPVVVDILVVTANHMEWVDFGEEGILIDPYIDVSECTKAGTEMAIFIAK